MKHLRHERFKPVWAAFLAIGYKSFQSINPFNQFDKRLKIYATKYGNR